MLLGSTALDVAIGLVFVYLAVSLVCSALNEVIEGRLKNRSKDLERGIRELLTNTTPAAQGTADAIPEGPARPNQLNIVQTLYDHPLISGLFKNDYSTAKKNGQLPSYIPSRNFALALMDIVGRAAAGGGGTANATAPVPALAPGQVAPAPAAPGNPLTPLREAAMSFATQNPKVSRAVVALIDAAGADPNRARQNIEDWFNSSMDRVSGWYKRRAQQITMILGLLIAVIANVDSIAMVRVLSTDAGVREALVAQAKESAAIRRESGITPAQAANASAVPSGGGGKAEEDLNDSVQRLRRLGLPIGWDWNNRGSVPGSNDINGWAMKIFGIFLTGLAVSLGAPFWFDLLNKFIVIRSTVKPTEKSAPEKSKE